MLKKVSGVQLTGKVVKIFGMLFFKISTVTEEYSVSVRIEHSSPTTAEIVSALKRLVVELKRAS